MTMVQVKPLVWNEILTHGGEALSASFGDWNRRIYLRGAPRQGQWVEEQKAKAQAEFDEYIRSALVDDRSQSVDQTDGEISTVWRAAMTVACNIVIKRQNDLNDEDGSMDVLNEQGQIIHQIKKWLEPDRVYLEELRRILGYASSASAASSEPAAVRYGFDGSGYQYLDNGSGSDWLTREPDAEKLFTHPAAAPAAMDFNKLARRMQRLGAPGTEEELEEALRAALAPAAEERTS